MSDEADESDAHTPERLRARKRDGVPRPVLGIVEGHRVEHAAAALWAFDQRTAAALEECVTQSSAELRSVLKTYGACTLPQIVGRVGEVWHAATFNRDAILRGVDVRAATTASLRYHSAAADVVVRGGAVGVQAQSKMYSTPESNAAHHAREAYGVMQRIVPADQTKAVVECALRRAATLLLKRPARARSYAEVAKRATDRLVAGGAASQPLTRAQAESLVETPSRLENSLREGRFARDLSRGAVGGAVVGGTLSALVHGYRAAKRQECVAPAARHVAVDTIKGAAAGAVTTAGARIVAAGFGKAGLHGLARSAAPVAIAAAALNVGGTIVDYARGNIDGRACAVRSAESLALGAAGWGGAELGALLGTALFPGIGTAIGAIIGGLAACFGLRSLLR